MRVCLALLLLITLNAEAQEPDSRAAIIDAERRKKAAQLTPETQPKGEQRLLWFRENRILERFTNGTYGLRVKLGGLGAGLGFAAGPEYIRRGLRGGGYTFRASARGTVSGSQLLDVQYAMPQLANDHVAIDIYSVHRNLARLGYYGPGPGSDKSGRSNYRLEDTLVRGALQLKPFRHFYLGWDAGYLWVNVGPGNDRRFASTEQLYGPFQAAGVDRQTNFALTGVEAGYDYRDIPGGPRRGGNYAARYSWYADQNLNQFSFRRLDLEAQQYIPFFNERRVIALRAKTTFTDKSPGQRIPFYLQPTLGGSDDLRGYRAYRFHDDNMLVMNAEYRWETFSGLDMAIFADAGKVFGRKQDWDFSNLESAAGFGFRFNVRNEVFMRLDFGFSHEGFQAWLKFMNVF